MKVSVCLTVFNEEKSITDLLQSLISQTKKPFEIVICDGGSTDGTVQIIKQFMKSSIHRSRIRVRDDDGIPRIKLLVSKGNVAHGRNIAIKQAKGDLIACIDAGCIAKKDWLEKLMKAVISMESHFHGNDDDKKISRSKSEITVVAGFYEMKWKTPFQKIMALYRGTHPKRYDPKTFIPSCRSVLFSKKMWKELHGFDETLSLSGEDTDFFYRVLQKGYSITQVKKAIVYWNEPKQFSLKDFKKFYYYARGDAQTNIWWDPVKKWKTHNIKILTIYIRYFMMILIPFLVSSIFVYCLLLFAYCFWSIWKWRDVVTDWRERVWIPIIQIGTDVMVMIGFLRGFLSKISINC